MNKIKQGIQLLIIVLLFILLQASALPLLKAHAPHSLADFLHLSPSKDKIDGGWLPNITGLPEQSQFGAISQHVADVMKQETDSRCLNINSKLRMTIFQHFAIYQEMANAQGIYFDENTAHKWGHLLGMILKESSGDPTSVSDFTTGREMSTYQPKTNLSNWEKIKGLTTDSKIPLNYQTNFGLTQTSADRLFVAFHLAKDQQYATQYLEGKEGAATPRKTKLNTAIAIRRLIWFYQDFAQGRLSQDDARIPHQEIDNPEFSLRYQTGLNMALLYCGTPFTYDESIPELKQAMASIAYCKLGNSQKGYGLKEMDERCFAQWVTLCPALNIDIATLTPLSYFATRNEQPVCEQTFNRLIKSKPE